MFLNFEKTTQQMDEFWRERKFLGVRVRAADYNSVINTLDDYYNFFYEVEEYYDDDEETIKTRLNDIIRRHKNELSYMYGSDYEETLGLTERYKNKKEMYFSKLFAFVQTDPRSSMMVIIINDSGITLEKCINGSSSYVIYSYPRVDVLDHQSIYTIRDDSGHITKLSFIIEDKILKPVNDPKFFTLNSSSSKLNVRGTFIFTTYNLVKLFSENFILNELQIAVVVKKIERTSRYGTTQLDYFIDSILTPAEKLNSKVYFKDTYLKYWMFVTYCYYYDSPFFTKGVILIDSKIQNIVLIKPNSVRTFPMINDDIIRIYDHPFIVYYNDDSEMFYVCETETETVVDYSFKPNLDHYKRVDDKLIMDYVKDETARLTVSVKSAVFDVIGVLDFTNVDAFLCSGLKLFTRADSQTLDEEIQKKSAEIKDKKFLFNKLFQSEINEAFMQNTYEGKENLWDFLFRCYFAPVQVFKRRVYVATDFFENEFIVVTSGQISRINDDSFYSILPATGRWFFYYDSVDSQLLVLKLNKT